MTTTPPYPSIETGHLFRSEVIQQCALVEDWTVSILTSPKVKTVRKAKVMLPRLFGQKLRAVGDLAKEKPEMFRKSGRIDVLLNDFQQYADMRSELAHSVLTYVPACDEAWMIFTNSGVEIAPHTPSRITMTAGECKSLLSKLKQQVKQIRDQKLK